MYNIYYFNTLPIPGCTSVCCNKVMPTLKPLPTRVPKILRDYLKAYARLQGRMLDDVCIEILDHFLTLRPFEQGLKMRTPVSLRSSTGQKQEWVQLNFFLSHEMALKVVALSEGLSEPEEFALDSGRPVSRAAILYTALHWFVSYMIPPNQRTTRAATGDAA